MDTRRVLALAICRTYLFLLSFVVGIFCVISFIQLFRYNVFYPRFQVHGGYCPLHFCLFSLIIIIFCLLSLLSDES